MSSKQAWYMARSGFTLMEVMAGLIIISIVSSIVLPGIDNFFSGMRVKADAEIFVQNIRMARYRAIEEQAVYRLIFDSANPLINTPSTYRVQTHVAFDNPPVVPYAAPNLGENDYDSVYWADVAETEFSFETGTEILTDLPQDIYFWPNGQIYATADINNSAASTISEHYAGFTYGSSGIKVIITPMGVFSSESYAADEVDITDDTEVLW